jgi:mannose-6-phosphate isomerase-like protein (cupin superfamily)
MEKIVLAEKFRQIHDHWRPAIVGELNGQVVRLVKFQGEFVWHQHSHQDELFMPIRGAMRVEFRDHTVDLQPGEFLIVPRTVDHRTAADEEVELLLFEPRSTTNTGDVQHPSFTAPPETRL